MASEAEELTLVTDGRRHLVCVPYSVENLHAMARGIGLSRAWFHAGRSPHYDVPVRRRREIEALCRIVRPRELLSIIRGGSPCVQPRPCS
jgi:Protein of unknown function (DUF4031)